MRLAPCSRQQGCMKAAPWRTGAARCSGKAPGHIHSLLVLFARHVCMERLLPQALHTYTASLSFAYLQAPA